MLFCTTEFLADKFSVSLFQYFITKGFRKFFDRAYLISMVGRLFPSFNICGIHSPRDIYLAIISKQKFVITVIEGFILADTVFVSLALPNAFIFQSIVAEVY
jgi:hypothetical protein